MNLHPCPLCGESKGYDEAGGGSLYCSACCRRVATNTAVSPRFRADNDAAWNAAAAHAQGLRERIEELERDNANLKTVMVAAAEEIHAHWDSHCDADGYGPQNLMRRLEDGIPSEYGYTAGAFAAQQKRIAELEAQRVPLTDEQIERIRLELCDMDILGCEVAKKLSRRVERAHGIEKGKN